MQNVDFTALSKEQECIGTFFQGGTFVQIGARHESHSKREHEPAYQSSEGISGMYYGSGGVSHCGIDVFGIWYAISRDVLNNFLIVIRYHIRSSLWTKKHCLWKREGENEDRRGCGVGSWWLAVPSSSSWRTWADFLLRRSSDRRSMGPYSLSLRGKVSSFSRIAINKRLDLDWKESCGILFVLLVTLTWLGGRYSWGSPEDTLTLILAKSWR